ncbi:MAG: iron ABC transporter permease [Firmicutes bacterium]|nr:iron ABC transporter permease [Bacillota bacterium]
MTAKKKNRIIFISLSLLLLGCCILSLSLGRYPVPFDQTLSILLHKIRPLSAAWNEDMANVVLNVRLPRLLGGVLVGAALAASGATYQSIFRNPLVSPDLLGVSAGACTGAALAIVLHAGTFMVQMLALVCGLAAVGLTNLIPRFFRNQSSLMLVLAGVVVGGFMNALFGILKYVADPEQELASIVYWTMGSFANIKQPILQALAPGMLAALAVLFLLRWRINVLSLGEREAASLGINVGLTRGLCILCATALTACAVCLSGAIGWIGLITPHFARLLTGEDARSLLPASVLIGAILTAATDWLARNLTGAEIPLSILTGLVGAPAFIILLLAQKRKIQE